MSSLIPWNWGAISEPTHHNGFAVYAIRLLKNHMVIPINRFLGTDTEGLLTLGMTTNLESRRRQFIQGLKKGYGHSSANLIFILMRDSPAFANLVPEPEYQIAYRIAESNAEARKLESEFTKKYFNRFGECPPLTSVLPNRYDVPDSESNA